MSFIASLIYDRCMAGVEDACLSSWRKSLIKNASGSVLEIGAGTGANIDYYGSEVTQLVFSEPDKNMRNRLSEKVNKSGLANIRVTSDTAEAINADSDFFDSVVVTLVCCSVTSLEAALLEIKRVLRPGGKLFFLEHVAATDSSSRRKWQNHITPIWRKFSGNCHLNRETEQAVLQAGFTIQEIQRESMRKAISLVRPTIRGIAVKPL